MNVEMTFLAGLALLVLCLVVFVVIIWELR